LWFALLGISFLLKRLTCASCYICSDGGAAPRLPIGDLSDPLMQIDDAALLQIDATKEKLFGMNMMAGFEKRYRIYGSLGLLEQLSVPVDPKPHDPHWYNVKQLYFIHTLVLFHSCSMNFFISIIWNLDAGCKELNDSVFS
jgi:hypothetical protein